MAVFNAIAEDCDHQWSFIDGTIVKAHQHSAVVRKEYEAAIGKLVAGNTTKIHRAVDAFGLSIHFEMAGGQVHDRKTAPQLVLELKDLEFIVVDKR